MIYLFFHFLAAEFYRLGNPPPRGISSQVAAPASDSGVIMLVDHPVTVTAEVIAFDMYGFTAEEFTVSVSLYFTAF